MKWHFYHGTTALVTRTSLLSRIQNNHTQAHYCWWNSSGRLVSPSQRPLPDKTQHSQRQKSMPPTGFESTIPASERTFTHPIDRARPLGSADTVFLFFFSSPHWSRASSFKRFLDHTQRRTTVGRTTLDEWLDRRRNLYLTTHNTHNRQTSMPPVWFETTISAGEQPKTYALDRAAAATGKMAFSHIIFLTI
jgi:hypothetical protein